MSSEQIDKFISKLQALPFVDDILCTSVIPFDITLVVKGELTEDISNEVTKLVISASHDEDFEVHSVSYMIKI